MHPSSERPANPHSTYLVRTDPANPEATVEIPRQTTRIVIELRNGSINANYFVDMLRMFMVEQRWAQARNGSGGHYDARVVSVEPIE